MSDDKNKGASIYTRRKPKPENLAKLTPEQRGIYDAWVKEQAQVDVLVQQGLDAMAANDQESTRKIFQKLNEVIPEFCEHGRSIWIRCLACEDIERTLFPELYDADGNPLPDSDDSTPEKLEQLYNKTKSKLDIN